MKVKSESEIIQSSPTVSDPMDCSLPGSSVHRILQARVLEWGAIAFSVCPPEQHLISPHPVPPVRKFPQASYPHPSEGRQNENHNYRKLTKLTHGSWPCLTQWNYKPCHAGPPKVDGSWWKVLTKPSPLEKGTANHFSILSLRTQ